MQNDTKEKINESRIGRLIGNSSRLWRRVANRRLQPYGLTEATWLPLLRISRSRKRLRQKDLANILTLDGSSVVRLLDSLERAGLVRRVESAEDRRSKEIVLTDEGRNIVAKVEGVASTLIEEATRGLPHTDIEATERVLVHITQFLANEIGEETE